jgi:hypothetical protein
MLWILGALVVLAAALAAARHVLMLLDQRDLVVQGFAYAAAFVVAAQLAVTATDLRELLQDGLAVPNRTTVVLHQLGSDLAQLAWQAGLLIAAAVLFARLARAAQR